MKGNTSAPAAEKLSLHSAVKSRDMTPEEVQELRSRFTPVATSDETDERDHTVQELCIRYARQRQRQTNLSTSVVNTRMITKPTQFFGHHKQ